MARTRKKPTPNPKPKPARDGSGLTYKQRLFVAYYLGKAGGNATGAARLAGYSCPEAQGKENLRKPPIRAAIEANLAAVALSADEVLARLSDMASVDMADFVTLGVGRGYTLDLKGAKDRGKTHLIKKLSNNQWGVTVELHDAQAALEKLGRYHGLFDQKGVEPEESPPSLAQVRAAVRERNRRDKV